jgi:hypothetical protein
MANTLKLLLKTAADAQAAAAVNTPGVLEAEKDNDSPQKELQVMQRVMEPKRARTNATAANDQLHLPMCHQSKVLVVLLLSFSWHCRGCKRKYSCWCKVCSLVRGRGHGCVSRHKFLDAPGCLRSKLTVWKEEQFTVLPFQGIEQRKKRVSEWVVKALLSVKTGVWGLRSLEGMGPKRFVLSVDDDTEFRSRCE